MLKVPLLENKYAPSENLMPDKNKASSYLQCTVIGSNPIPFVDPNIHPQREIEDIEKIVHNSVEAGCSCDGWGMCSAALCCALPVIGWCYNYNKTVLINSNQYGFIVDSGDVMFLRPGWHYIGSVFINRLQIHDISEEYIQVNNLRIIRIRQDEVGIGINNTALEILLPGTHCRTDGNYDFKGRFKLNADITEGPIKIKTVKTGTVSVCYMNGKAQILFPGRYAINSNGFIVGQDIDITQQNLKFSKHNVLLEGGINMLVEGLLTYQIVDVEKLVKNCDIKNLNKYLEEIMKADLTKVFSTIHLEQIASSNRGEMKKNDASVAETRLFIYDSIMKMIKPQADEWGLSIINFQLESTQLADQKYSSDYEAASLQIAKSKAELKAQESQNNIMIQQAQTQANVALINAESQKKIVLMKAKATAKSRLVEAEATASSIMKEGEAKAEAAALMDKNKYGQELALLNAKSVIAEGLKIHTLVMGAKSDLDSGKSIIDSLVPVLNL